MTFLMLLLPQMVSHAGATDSVTTKPQILRQDSITKGYEPLPIGEQSIAAAYMPQTLGISRGAVLLLHDINEHIDSAAIGILRKQLPEYGWNTLAIKIIRFTEESAPTITAQDTAATSENTEVDSTEAVETAPTESETASDNTLPQDPDPETQNTELDDAVASEAPSYEVTTTAQRIDAALLKLQQEGHENIVLIGQGAGGELALKTIRETAVPVAAVVMINTGELADTINITETTIPILEILGSRQNDSIKKAIRNRQVKMKTQQNNNYQIREIVGAAHYFSNATQQLTNMIHGWLYRQFFAEEATP